MFARPDRFVAQLFGEVHQAHGVAREMCCSGVETKNTESHGVNRRAVASNLDGRASKCARTTRATRDDAHPEWPDEESSGQRPSKLRWPGGNESDESSSGTGAGRAAYAKSPAAQPGSTRRVFILQMQAILTTCLTDNSHRRILMPDHRSRIPPPTFRGRDRKKEPAPPAGSFFAS